MAMLKDRGTTQGLRDAGLTVSTDRKAHKTSMRGSDDGSIRSYPSSGMATHWEGSSGGYAAAGPFPWTPALSAGTVGRRDIQAPRMVQAAAFRTTLTKAKTASPMPVDYMRMLHAELVRMWGEAGPA